MEWNDDLASLDEEPGLVDMETVNEEADTFVTAQEEANEVEKLERSRFPLKEGDIQYLVSKRWFRDWEAYAGYPPDGQQLIRAEHSSQDRPGTIDNSDILDDSAVDKLKPHLQEGKDFKLLSEDAWSYLLSLYGGGPVVMRRVVLQKDHPVVEIYPMVLKIKRSSDPSSEICITISSEASFTELKEKACKAYNLEEVDVVMWDYWGDNYYGTDGPLDDYPDERLSKGKLMDKQPVMLLEKNEDGTFPDVKPKIGGGTHGPNLGGSIQLGRPTAAVNTSGYSYGRNSYSTDTTYQVEGKKRGLAGLSNLGNTCFMNSSVQCLAHAAPLVRVFLSGDYRQDLNTDNPLGNKGELAEAFGNLMKLLWQGGVGSVSPKGFKAALARFAPQFGGYSQQDSQELLAFLLDGLHEDLNRVRQKPYVEEADADGRPDKVVAAEAWANYRKRNDSVIVDHFQGLYKSTLICPQCNFSSVKFDPFMYLSLPLPSSKTRTLYITLIYVDGSQLPIVHAIDVPKTATIAAVYDALAQHAGVAKGTDPMEVLLLAVLAANRVTRTFTDPEQSMPERRDTAQLLAYRYSSPAEGPKSGNSQVHLLHRRRLRKRGGMVGFGGADASQVFAAPLVLFLPAHDIQSLSEQTVKKTVEWTKEYTVERPNKVEQLLEDALRPFKRPKIEDGGNSASGSSTSGRDISALVDDMFARPVSLPNGKTTPADKGPENVFGNASAAPAFGSPPVHSAMDVDHDLQQMSGPLQQSLHESFELMEAPTGDDMQSPTHGDAAAEFNQPFSDEESVPIEMEPSQGPGGDGEVSSQHRIEVAPQRQSSDLQWEAAVAAPADAGNDGWGGDEDWGNARCTWPGMGPDPEPNPAPDSPSLASTNQGLESSAAPNVTPQATPNASPIVSPEGSPRASALPPVQPFNMWQPVSQSEELDVAVEPVTLSNGDAKASWPWRLKWADAQGSTRLYSDPVTAAQQLHFAVEWAAEGAAQYDVGALESPRLSDSARAAQEREEAATSSHFSLHQCVEAFLQPEQLDTVDSWYCGRCKEHVRAEKKLDLWSLPELLVVHLKRFSYSRHSRDKLDAPVVFPLSNLDLSSFVLREQDVTPVYDLYAVSNHFGGLGGGHYTAFCRMDDGTWQCFDDSHVSPVDESSVESKAAYVLFYRRRHEAQRDPGTLPEQLADMAEAAASTASEQPTDVLQQTQPQQHALPNGTATAEPESTAEATAEVPSAEALPERTHANGGSSPTTQLEDSFVFLSDGGSSKEEDLYGDTSPDASGAAALQQSSPAAARGLKSAKLFQSSAAQEEGLTRTAGNGFSTNRKLFDA